MTRDLPADDMALGFRKGAETAAEIIEQAAAEYRGNPATVAAVRDFAANIAKALREAVLRVRPETR